MLKGGKPGNRAGCLGLARARRTLEPWHVRLAVTSQAVTLALGGQLSLPGSPECACSFDARPAFPQTFLRSFWFSPPFCFLYSSAPGSSVPASSFYILSFWFCFFPGRFMHLSSAVSAGPRVELAFPLLSFLIATRSLFSETDRCHCSVNHTLSSCHGPASSCCERLDVRRCISTLVPLVVWSGDGPLLWTRSHPSPYPAHLSLLQGARVPIQQLGVLWYKLVAF